jgi:hypothetical protein
LVLLVVARFLLYRRMGRIVAVGSSVPYRYGFGSCTCVLNEMDLPIKVDPDCPEHTSINFLHETTASKKRTKP